MQVRPPRACRGGANAGPLVALTARDKQGCSIGFIDLEVKGETEEAGSSQASKAVYFHSAPSASGFKHAGTGTVQSAGLELMRGDQLSDLLKLQNTVFIGTTTTGSSLVHFKLYWVPACAALRLGSDARLK